MIAFFRWSFSPSFSLKKGPLSPKAWASKDVGSLYSLSSTLKIWGIRRSTRAKWLWDDFWGEIVVTPEWARNCHAHCENRQITTRNVNTSTGDSICAVSTDICQKKPSWWFWFSWKSFHPVACVTGSVGRCFRMGTCCLSHNGVSYASDPHEKTLNSSTNIPRTQMTLALLGEKILHPLKVAWLWKIHREWRCIYYWKWG